MFAPVNIEKRKLCEHRPCLLDNVHRSGMHFVDLFELAASELCSDQVAEAAHCLRQLVENNGERSPQLWAERALQPVASAAVLPADPEEDGSFGGQRPIEPVDRDT